jgi:hypothetical protein
MCKGVPRRPKVSSSQRFGALQRFYITAAVFTAVSLVTPYNEQIFAASPDAAEGPEKTVLQGRTHRVTTMRTIRTLRLNTRA